MKVHFVPWLLIFTLAVSGCSIDVNQQPVQTPAATAPALPSTQIPVTWTNLNLNGKLVYINGYVKDEIFSLQLQVLDLVTGDITTIFDAPKYSWIYYFTVSPDYKQLVMSYSPPPEGNLVDQDLYVMPLDGSAPPQLLFTPP